MDGHSSHPTTKRSLIKPEGEYPDVQADVASSQQHRSIVTGSAYRSIDLRGAPEGLGIYPYIVDSGGSNPSWGRMPCTDTMRDAGLEGVRGKGFQPHLFTKGYETGYYNFETISHYKEIRSTIEEAQHFPRLLRGRFSQFQTLAKYAERSDGNMTMEEKRALMDCLLLMGKEHHFFHYAMPEAFVRFINPLGSMGDIPSYEGLTAYFYDLANRVQHHSFYAVGDYSQDKNVNEFFATNPGMELPEAARLIGLAAKHWGIDRHSTEQDAEKITTNMRRFYLYLFHSKMAQCIKERAYEENSHSMLSIDKGDAKWLMEYAKGDFHKKFNLKPTVAEQELMDEIKCMAQPAAQEYGEMQRLLQQGDPCPAPGAPKYRIYQYGLMNEKYHAMNFLFENNNEGRKLVFGR